MTASVNPTDQIREAAEADLVTFIKLVSPKQVLGGVHEELCRWWTREKRKKFQLVLLPRDHGKSRMVAYRVAWEITRRPWIRILYISATSNLAEKQLKFIQDILESRAYRDWETDRKSTRLNSSHSGESRMPSSA